ncbi:MAG TPA: GNAT family N-acetyltransferase, partial [Chloroflexia bacterium]|nr:GNAT family N-acetyltransferase [Chloroflexia bacterium]
FNASWAADGIDSVFTELDLRMRLSAPKLDVSRHVIVADSPPAEGVPAGTVAGFGMVIPSDDLAHDRRTYMVNLYTHPAVATSGLDRTLMRKLVEIARENEEREETNRVGVVRLKAIPYEKQASLRALLQSCGMQEVRQFWLMHRALDEPIDEPQDVEGVIIRPYRRPEDNKPGVAAYNNSFIDHFDFHVETEAEWEFKANTPFFKPELSRIAEVEGTGEIAGFCICAVFDHENQATGRLQGWISLLGTTRSWRGKGLGRSLLLHGLQALKGAGLQTAVLGVDTESLTGANRLYESAGFHVHERTMHYECLLSEVAV